MRSEAEPRNEQKILRFAQNDDQATRPPLYLHTDLDRPRVLRWLWRFYRQPEVRGHVKPWKLIPRLLDVLRMGPSRPKLAFQYWVSRWRGTEFHNWVDDAVRSDGTEVRSPGSERGCLGAGRAEPRKGPGSGTVAPAGTARRVVHAARLSAKTTKPPVHQATGPREQYTSPTDIFLFEAEATLCLLLIWVILLAAMAGWLSVYWLALTPILYIRFELAGHELLHCRTGRQVNWFLRHMAVAQAPYSSNYDVYRAHHLAHHRHLGTARDPEGYLIDPPAWRSLLNALFALEVVAFHWMRSHRLGPRFWADLAVRVGLFGGLLVWNWQVFLIYLLCLRSVLGFAEYFFHHCLHNENDPVFRAFDFLWRWCPWFWKLLLGSEKMPILLYHDEHHAEPLVAAKYLPQRRLAPASGHCSSNRPRASHREPAADE